MDVVVTIGTGSWFHFTKVGIGSPVVHFVALESPTAFPAGVVAIRLAVAIVNRTVP